MNSLTVDGTTKYIDPVTGLASVNGAPSGSFTSAVSAPYNPPNIAQVIANRGGTPYQPASGGGGSTAGSGGGGLASYQGVPGGRSGSGYTSASSGTSLPYGSKLDELIAILQGHLTANDSQIASQADALYQAQRAVADREINSQVQNALGANGVLPTGGLASRLYQELSAPITDRINAQRAQSEIDLRQNRNNGYQQLTGTVAGIQNNWAQLESSKANQASQLAFQREQAANQQRQFDAELAQKGQLASQQLAADQARQAQASQLAQAQLDYQKMSDAQKLAFQREALTAENQRLYSNSGGSGGGGTRTGSGGGGGGSSAPWNFDMRLGEGMQQNYDQMVVNERLRSGLSPTGAYDGNSRAGSFGTTPSQRGAYDAAQRQANPNYSGLQQNPSQSGSPTPGVQAYLNPAGGSGTASGGSGWGSLTAAAQPFYTPPASGSNFTAATGFGSGSQMASGLSQGGGFYNWGS